jgi:hypothetical protein
LKSILAWYEAEAHEVDPEKDPLEDRLVELHHEFAGRLANLYVK